MRTKSVAYGLLVVTILGVILQAAFLFRSGPKVGGDFQLRMYEVKCLLERVDPYDVWSGAVHHPPYCSYVKAPDPQTGEVHAVNAYPPWAYTFALPLAVLPVSVSGALYFAFMMASLVALFLLGKKRGERAFGSGADAVWVAAVPLFLLVPSIGSNLQSFNWPFLVLMATLAMVWCLNRQHDVWAGVCWAIAMMKPQIALLYAIPLLLRKRFRTCFVAAGLCLIASIPPALLVGRNPVTMMMEGIKGSSSAFFGCGTFPYFLCLAVGSGLDVICGLLVGAAVCGWLILRYCRQLSWFELLGIAAGIATLWTYSQLYNTVLMWPLFVLFAEDAVRLPSNGYVRLFEAAVLLFMTRAYTFVHGFLMLYPNYCYSFDLHGHLDSLNSFVCLVLVILICRRHAQAQSYE